MKHLLAYLLLITSLMACSGINNGSCTPDGDICVKLRVEEPILFGEPVGLVITATSSEDISQLGISLIIWPHTMIVGEATDEEPGIEVWKGESGIAWKVNIRAGEVLTIRRILYIPAESGEYTIAVHANTPQLRVIDQLSLYQTDEEIKVYLSGTEIPFTPGPLPTMNPIQLQTLRALPTSTPLRTLTPIPTNTSTPTSPAYPPPASPTSV
jgi:hypothetical protein